MRDFLNLSQQDDENWLPIADIMTSLFVIFLFIAIIAIKESTRLETTTKRLNATISKDLGNVRDAVYSLAELKDAIYKALMQEFRYDLVVWRAEIDRNTLSVRFKEPEILFYPGSHAIRPRFQQIITDFFPRYINRLRDFRTSIDEIKIEGHTSSEWVGAETVNEAFTKNMALSQQRTLSVLLYALRLELPDTSADWARQKVTANGYSSTRLIRNASGREDKPASRRVEFRVYTDDAKVLDRIRGAIAND